MLRLTHRTRDVPWLAADGAKGLYFYGEAIDSLFTRHNVYQLTWAPGTTMEIADGHRTGRTDPQATFQEQHHYEEDHEATPHLARQVDEDYWMWQLLSAGHPRLGSTVLDFDAPGRVARGGEAQLTLRLRSATQSGLSAEHHVAVSLNGTALGDTRWSGVTAHEATLSFSEGLLESHGNELEITAVLDPGIPFSLVYVDDFDVSYRRDYRTTGASLSFGDGDNRFLAPYGFSRSDLLVFDISEPMEPMYFAGLAVESMDSGYGVRFEGRSGGRYLAVQGDGLLTPVSLRPVRAPDLRRTDREGEYLVIAPTQLVEVAQGVGQCCEFVVPKIERPQVFQISDLLRQCFQ
jgi:hypothetical protein